MSSVVNQKVTSSHLKRNAYLYVRQSTLRQVLENTESTKRQYALQERAVGLGWPIERIVVIDSDLGQSGASAVDREGFQRLVSEVGLGRAGIVLGLEVSRLARSSVDWHRLLEIYALTDTLILDEDGIYDPSHFNDRLLLGLKGTMSEAELHVLKARLQGGILSKARRGELMAPLPVGLAYGPDDRVVLDPDQQVQKAMRLFFQTFRQTSSAWATAREFRTQGFQFPRRLHTGPHKGELVWGPLLHCRALQIVKNPRYAGAFFYGRSHTRKTADGKHKTNFLPRDEWHTLTPDAHPGYILWADYEDNLRILRENAHIFGNDRRKSPPREGPALLQGLAVCGLCGDRMTVRYHTRRGKSLPNHVCQRFGLEHGDSPWQNIIGWSLDKAIGKLLVEAVMPLALEAPMLVQEEINTRAEEADRLRRQQVEHARYEADLAQRRYMKVDPDNRLVANTLEANWNEKLRALVEAQEEYERQCEGPRLVVDEQRRAEIATLATDFPRLWRDPRTPDRERKRMVRLMIEDVTLLKEKQITAQVRFKGGATRTLTVPLPLGRETDPEVVQEIDRLLDLYTDQQIAEIINKKRWLLTYDGKAFGLRRVGFLRRTRHLEDRFSRLRTAGLLTIEEVAATLGVCTCPGLNCL